MRDRIGRLVRRTCLGHLGRCGCVALALLAGAASGPALVNAPAAGDPGPTPAERVDFVSTPAADEVEAYLNAVAATCCHVTLGTFGYTASGRPLPVVFVQDAADRSATAPDTTKPVVLVIAGIHSGEIEGKDAILLLLRDIARGLEPVIVSHLRLVIVPIFNLDGHENRGEHHRFVQWGPEGGLGTRRNAQWLDLNRDFAKLESPECAALVRLGAQFQPHIFVDLHTNDGYEHQYDVLFGAGVDPTLPGARDGVARRLVAATIEAMAADGFRAHEFGYPVDDLDLTRGIATYGIPGHLAHGYFQMRHCISILDETHPYLPYERRVRSTDSMLRGILHYAAQHRIDVVDAVNGARATAIRWARAPGRHALALGCSPDTTRPRTIQWLGKAYAVVTSDVTGRRYTRYRNEPVTFELPLYGELKPERTTTLPRGYLILPAWGKVVETLERHSIHAERLTQPFMAEVEAFRASSVRFSAAPSQGHHPIQSVEWRDATETRGFPPGTYWVPLDQPAGIVAFHLLEPRSPETLLNWNAFDAIFEQGIITEDWSREDNARTLLADPEIRAEYEAALADSSTGLARDPDARLDWFFRRTPFVDEEQNLYPVFRVLGPGPGAP
jgi:hypothetical protein